MFREVRAARTVDRGGRLGAADRWTRGRGHLPPARATAAPWRGLLRRLLPVATRQQEQREAWARRAVCRYLRASERRNAGCVEVLHARAVSMAWR